MSLLLSSVAQSRRRRPAPDSFAAPNETSTAGTWELSGDVTLLGAAATIGGPALAKVEASASSMVVEPTSGSQFGGLDELWFVWDQNEVLLPWNVAGYYETTTIDAEVFRDHFSRQDGVAQLCKADVPPVLSSQINVNECSVSGTLQSDWVSVADSRQPGQDAVYMSTTTLPDVFGTNYAATVTSQWYEDNREFISGTVAMWLDIADDTSSVGFVAPWVYFDYTKTRLVDRSTGTIKNVSMPKPDPGFHQMVITVKILENGDNEMVVYIDGINVYSRVESDPLINTKAGWINSTGSVSQWICDDEIWDQTKVDAHYNGGSAIEWTTRTPGFVGAVYGDSLTTSVNYNTWNDTINGRYLKWPSWKDYLANLHGKVMCGAGYDGRNINVANVTQESIQRLAHLAPDTKHFLYLGANNQFSDDDLATSQSELLAAIAEIEGQGHEAILFNLPPGGYNAGQVTLAASYDAWLTPYAASNGYKIIDPKVILADPGTYDLKAEYNTNKAGATRPDPDPTHYNNYGHRDLAAYISQIIDNW